MKPSVAFLLSVYSNIEQANMFIRQVLQYERAEVFVHLDCKLSPAAKNLILSNNRVHILPESYDVQWGEYMQIKVYNELFKYAIKGDFDYYSLNSGVDLLTRPIDDFIEWLEQTAYYACYNCAPMPKDYWQFRGGFGRIELYWPKFFLKRLSDHHPLRYLRTIYGMLYDKHIISGRKAPDKYKYYGGNDWFTLSRECVYDMLCFIDSHPDFDQLFHHSYIGTEIYYVSIFEMIRENKKVLSNNNLRYVDWVDRGQRKNAGSPNTITMACYDTMMDMAYKDNRFFARKFNYMFDKEVVDLILKQTLGDIQAK